jgi:flagellar biosynthesis/type III secretory pathway protein FliH
MDWENEIKKILFEDIGGWKKIFVYDDFRKIRNVINKLIKEIEEKFSLKIREIYQRNIEELNKIAEEKYYMGKTDGYNKGFTEGYIKGTMETSKFFTKKLLKRSVINKKTNKKQDDNSD